MNYTYTYRKFAHALTFVSANLATLDDITAPAKPTERAYGMWDGNGRTRRSAARFLQHSSQRESGPTDIGKSGRRASRSRTHMARAVRKRRNNSTCAVFYPTDGRLDPACVQRLASHGEQKVYLSPTKFPPSSSRRSLEWIAS